MNVLLMTLWVVIVWWAGILEFFLLLLTILFITCGSFIFSSRYLIKKDTAYMLESEIGSNLFLSPFFVLFRAGICLFSVAILCISDYGIIRTVKKQ